MTARTARATLAAIGVSPTLQWTLVSDVVRCRGRCWGHRGLEYADLLAIAIAATWVVLVDRPDASGGLIRLRVRWALREALRKEAYQRGVVRPRTGLTHARAAERHCRCGKSLGTMALGGVRCCARCQLTLDVNRCRRYRRRVRQRQAAA